MMEPFDFANSTSWFTWCQDAAYPVGLFGEQKNIISALEVVDKSGKKLFSWLQFMYTMFPYLPVSSWNFPARPRITVESINACSKISDF